MSTSTLHLHFTCRKATAWDRRLYFPSEGRRAQDFFALKIRRLRPGANPRTWVPKARTLPLDHRSRFICLYIQCIHFIPNILLLCFALQGVNRNRNHRLDQAFGSRIRTRNPKDAWSKSVHVPASSIACVFVPDYRFGNIAMLHV
jgi:hypothetical protein